MFIYTKDHDYSKDDVCKAHALVSLRGVTTKNAIGRVILRGYVERARYGLNDALSPESGTVNFDDGKVPFSQKSTVYA